MTREQAKILVRRIIGEEFIRETRELCDKMSAEIESGRVDPSAYDRQNGVNTPDDLRKIIDVMREFVAHVEAF